MTQSCLQVMNGVRGLHTWHMFAYLNELNARMQGRDENLLSSTDKINGFRSRISLWRQHFERGDTLEIFPLAQKWQEQVNTN